MICDKTSSPLQKKGHGWWLRCLKPATEPKSARCSFNKKNPRRLSVLIKPSLLTHLWKNPLREGNASSDILTQSERQRETAPRHCFTPSESAAAGWEPAAAGCWNPVHVSRRRVKNGSPRPLPLPPRVHTSRKQELEPKVNPGTAPMRGQDRLTSACSRKPRTGTIPQMPFILRN